MALLVATLAFGGCSQEREAVFLSGVDFEWGLFNHRLSYLSMGVTDVGVWASVIGGTSTTGEATGVPAECELDCAEFPFEDNANVGVQWGRVTSSRARFGTASATLVSGSLEEVVTLNIPLDGRATGTVAAVLTGLTLSTDTPLPAEVAGCYDPANGWHPRRILVSLDNVVVGSDGKSLDVDVTTGFTAGLSLESARACIDAVASEASVAFTIDVLGVARGRYIERHDMTWAYSYAWNGSAGNPNEQAPPLAEDRTVHVDESVDLFGWTGLDWSFHNEDPEGRGAYLRSLAWTADAMSGRFDGWATNYSPGTQLSAFDYTFSGRAVGLDVDGTLELGEVRWDGADALSALLDENGGPVIHTYDF